MNVSTGGGKCLVIVGATGMVGGYALRYALEHPAVQSATAIVRRKLNISHPKLKEVVHRDFADCSALAEVLSGQDAAIFCLGAYTGAVSDAELRTITVDYTIEFVRVLRRSSADAAFSFLSGRGADPTGRSRSSRGALFFSGLGGSIFIAQRISAEPQVQPDFLLDVAASYRLNGSPQKALRPACRPS